MMNKQMISVTAGKSPLLSISAILLILLFFPFKTATAQEPSADHQLFSEESQKQIIQMIYSNIMYPQDAKMKDLTGRFFVIVKMKKGGIVDKVSVNTTDKSINVPLLSFNEIVIVGYGLKNPAEPQNSKAGSGDLKLLTDEGIRVAKMLGTVKIPEWQNNDLEFAVSLKFQLNYPEEKTNIIKIGDNSFKVNPDPLIILDGKEVPKEQLSKIDPKDIESMSVLKDASATKVYGEKGKNGVIVIKTKK